MSNSIFPHIKPVAVQGTFLNGRIHVLVGDICAQQVDAIVNAANSTLLGGGGVDGAIHDAGGPAILEQCEEIRRTRYPHGLPTGEAVITSGGLLPARYVIHTVGPIKGVHGEQDASLLASCYTNCLSLAVQHKLRTLAFPAISTGIYGYPREEAAVVASEAISRSLERDSFLTEIRLIFFAQRDAVLFLKHQRFASTG
jgi:O-acetyl-ADP-ribose deacetylase (regulator of RNase III)